MPILMGTSIQIIYLGVVHKLHTLVMQNMPTIGKYRDMSRIYIALQGVFCLTLIGHVPPFPPGTFYLLAAS